ncbi:TetR family transcriptional regulator [Salinibacterium sp. M195]|uniref:TetR family transcriptional regulator n=1 Tax=Salinibacterium sp. M195 TaxID=2583374 RepID=UPI001C631528|nr:TetR family transcriptional regulator [Salinibacterium sp. M195]QYH34823.1 TetR family transcriptional regulator [Salinibacterium sp. M195]
MDARTRRSRDALVAAAYALAEQRDIATISVTDITNASGISRDTFYRHASDPVDLIANALHAELAEALGEFGDLLTPDAQTLPASEAMAVSAGSGTGSDRSSGSSASDTASTAHHVFVGPTRVFLTHVRTHATLYRMAASGSLSGRLRSVLIEPAREILAAHLRRHPEIVPADLAPLSATTFAMAVAYAAGGTVAAAEAWLVTGDLDDLEGAVHAVLAASPQWWGTRD